MPRELFGEVCLRPGCVRSRRSSVVMISLAAHAAVISAVLIAPLFATDTLPLPQRGGPVYVSEDIVPVSLPPSLPPRRAAPNPRSTAESQTIAPAAMIPLRAPSGITDETGLEGLPSGPGSGERASSIDEGPGLDPGALGRAEPPPRPIAPIRVYDGIRAPRKLVDVPPVYPPLARAAHIEGSVVIEATIGLDGSVQAARVLSGNHTGSRRLLEEAALEAVRQWKYSPTLLNGVPVPVIMTVTVNFTLR